MKINKILMFMFMILFSFSCVNAIADYPFDIANAEYNGLNLSVSIQESSPTSLIFNNDG